MDAKTMDGLPNPVKHFIHQLQYHASWTEESKLPELCLKFYRDTRHNMRQATLEEVSEKLGEL